MSQGRSYSYNQLKRLWIRAGGDPRYAAQMAAIALAESRGFTRARNVNTNGTIDRGLWQINSSHGYGKSSFNAMRNARQAVKVFNGTQRHTGNGFTAWSTYNNGAYKTYMNHNGGNQEVATGHKHGHGGGGGGGGGDQSLQWVLNHSKKKKGHSKRSGYIQPIASNDITGLSGEDSGQDYQTKAGSKVRAIGDAVIVGIQKDPGGFGIMIIYQLTSGPEAGTLVYIGHAKPAAGIHVGKHVHEGGAVAITQMHPGGNGTGEGHVEIGIAKKQGGAYVPAYPHGHGGTTAGGAAYRRLIGQAHSYSDQAQNSANQANANAHSQAYQAAHVQEQIASQEAKATAHVGNPWVTIKRNGKGQIVGFGQAYGAKPPKNVLRYAGRPMTQQDLSNYWDAKYSNIYEEYTGHVAGPAEIVRILHMGLTPSGLQQYLSKQPGFIHSPIYKQQSDDINSEAQKILGTDAPLKLIREAIAEGWSQATLDYHLRMNPHYEKGPEFQNNYAQMLNVYEAIYGKPDAAAVQSLQEAAAAQWSPDQMAAYLRAQPQYKTSKEYMNNVLNFLDGLGAVFGATPTLTPGQPAGATGGTPVQNSKFAPGTPTTLSNNLPFVVGLNFGAQQPSEPGQPAAPPPPTPPPTPPPPPETGGGEDQTGSIPIDIVNTKPPKGGRPAVPVS